MCLLVAFYGLMPNIKVIFGMLFLFWVAVGLASNSLLSPKGVNYEVAALMSVKNKMRDEYHVLDGWDINSVDPCTWNLVGCSSEGFVVSLEMASTGLSGTLSPSIGNLSHLQTMLLQNNQLSGSVLADIGKLSELRTLDLSGNQFTGEIPSSLGYLTHLSYLRLSRNKLSGQIPRPVASLTGLSFLDLSFNNLSGSAPKILAKDYSIAGNNFLCSSPSTQICIGVANPVNGTSPYRKISNHHHWVVSVVIGVSCTFVISVMLLFCWVRCYRSGLLAASYVQQDCEFDIGHLKRFSFRELQTATGNFNSKNILGHGGFGVVYKGYLPNRTVVAVKRLKDPNFSGEVQFQTEVEMISLALHRNLLRLYGFCLTSNERLLVYPYMPNGSVADRLRDTGRESPSLDWNKRMHIALGAARGLYYLHEQCNPKIIHRDVKAANILLDEGFEAVVGDFGLAKLLDRRDSHVTTAVRGTVGHIAPEYLSTGQSSEKTDVFGFGILLLELITGQKALDAGNGQVQKGMILDWVKTLYEEKRLEVLVDRDLKGCYSADELEKTVEVALLCTRSHPNLRPKMSEVLKVLESITGQPLPMEELEAGMIPCERSFGFGDPFAGFGGLGGHQNLVSDFFGGRDPFDDPFFTRPFGGMFESTFGPTGSMNAHQSGFSTRSALMNAHPSGFAMGGSPLMNGFPSGFSAGSPLMNAPFPFGFASESPLMNAPHPSGFFDGQSSQTNRSRGPIIEELNSDDEKEVEGKEEKKDNPKKHGRSSKGPYVEDPDDQIEERNSKQMHYCNELKSVNNSQPHAQAQSFAFQSSTVTYGGSNGAYYTSARTMRTGSDGLTIDESKEADSTTGRAAHRLSRGIHDKGHTVTRNLQSDGRVDTMQVLHNLDEDDLAGFEETWKGKARKRLPGWSEGLNVQNGSAGSSSQSGQKSRGGWALPSTERSQLSGHNKPDGRMKANNAGRKGS